MDAATVITLAMIIGAVGGLVALELAHRRRRRPAPAPDELERFLGLEVIVNTRRPDDQAVRGTLIDVGAVWLELRRASWLPTSSNAGKEAPMDGSALIPRSHVAYVQALSSAPAAVLERP